VEAVLVVEAEVSAVLAVAAPEAEAPAAVGDRLKVKRASMVPQQQIDDFIKRLREAAGENLRSVILYGSAASGEFHPEFSNVNLLCILRETSFVALTAIASAVKWWTRQKHRPPLFLTRDELEHSTDVFSIEYLDMQQRHKVLFGDDVVSGLSIPMHFHRAQLEYELREKLILLREQLIVSANDTKALWKLMLGSVSTFATLFRHALIVAGVPVPASKREAIQTLASRFQFDPAVFQQLFDIRERRSDPKQFDCREVFSKYLLAIEHVTAAVDKMLDSEENGRN
jgi:nucleotidyltransferase-like protein